MDALDPGMLSPFTLKNTVFNGQLINIIRNRLSSHITNTIYHLFYHLFFFFSSMTILLLSVII